MSAVEVLKAGQLSLSELAVRVNDEYRQCCDSLENALGHAIRCGELLETAKAEVNDRQVWENWCVSSLHFSARHADGFIRIFRYQHVLPSGIYLDKQGKTRHHTVNSIKGYIRGLPPLEGGGGKRKLSKEERLEISRLRSSGATIKDISSLMDVSSSTVYFILNPKKYQEHKQKARARTARYHRQRALEAKQKKQAEIIRSVKERGGDIADVYSLIRRAADRADNAITEAANATERRHMKRALAALYKAEDAIVDALRGAP